MTDEDLKQLQRIARLGLRGIFNSNHPQARRRYEDFDLDGGYKTLVGTKVTFSVSVFNQAPPAFGDVDADGTSDAAAILLEGTSDNVITVGGLAVGPGMPDAARISHSPSAPRASV